MDAVMLAAGSSVRFGANKLLYPLDHKPVYRYMLELLYQKQKEHRLNRLIAVSQYDEIFKDIKEHFPGVETVRNPEPEKGISGSVRLGLDRLQQKAGFQGSEACMFTVADQPGFSADSFEKMLDFWQFHDYGIVAAGFAGRPDAAPQIKNPVIFSSRYYQELQKLTGDAGGKQVVRRFLEDTGVCEIPGAELEDLDTKDALFRFQKRLAFIREFPFLKETGHIISIVGAGGKTTLMDTLASYYADMGRKVVVTTTTHIMLPKQYPTARNRGQLKSMLAASRITAVGADAPGGKLCLSDQMTLTDYKEAADIVLIEADGAKHFPCKVPRETEPVIPDESGIVIGVAGMDALDQPLSKVCFRKEEAMELLGVDERHLMTEEDLAEILFSEKGTRKDVGGRDYYIVLNKCDNEKTRERAGNIRKMLMKKGAQHVACLSCKEGHET